MVEKKAMSLPIASRREWIEEDSNYSIRRQHELAGISRRPFYYDAVPESEENLLLMRLIDEQYMRHPEYGSPRMTDCLCYEGYPVNHKRIARLTLFM